MEPKVYSEGLKDLLQEHPAEEICSVIIENSDRSNSCQKEIKIELELDNLFIPPERQFFYTPPGSVSHYSRSSRVESIPSIRKPDLCYLVIDDIFETGKTLASAVGMLLGQNVSYDNIWFIAEMILDNDKTVKAETSIDKASKFLGYRKPSSHPSPLIPLARVTIH